MFKVKLMQNKILETIKLHQERLDLPKIKEGCLVRVNVKIQEGNKERIQSFEGLVIAKRGVGLNQTFVVRKNSYGVGVERVFFYNSPLIQSIKVLRVNKVRRAKLYYMRKLQGKLARLKEIKSSLKQQ